MTTWFKSSSLFFLKRQHGSKQPSRKSKKKTWYEFQVDNKDYKDNQVQVCSPYLI